MSPQHSLRVRPRPTLAAAAACLLTSLLAPPTVAQELSPLADVTIRAQLPVDAEARAALGFGNSVAIVTQPTGPESELLELFNAEGQLLWARELSLLAGTFGRVAVAVNGDRTRLFVMRKRNDGELEHSLLEAFDVADGDLAWAAPATGPVTDTGPIEGRLAVAGDRVAVLRSGPPGPTAEPTLVPVFHDGLTGSELAAGPASAQLDAGLYFGPLDDLAVRWTFGGMLQGLDPLTGAELWSVDVPTTPGSVALGTGTTALARQEALGVFARSDGAGVMGFDAATGALLWANGAIEARDVIPYGSDRFFAAGLVGSGGVGGLHTYGMLDALTGNVIWSATTPSGSGTSSVQFLKLVHAARDETRGTVAFHEKRLFVADAANGAVLADVELGNDAREGDDLERLDNGTWVVSAVSPLFGSSDNLEAFSPFVDPLWTIGAREFEAVDTRSTWADLSADGTQVHHQWSYVNFEPLSDGPGRYQVRDAVDAALVADWAYPFNSTYQLALRPSADRVAVLRTGSINTYVDFLETASGSLLASTEYTGNSTDDPGALVWAPGGARLFTAWEQGSGLRIASLDADGQKLWTRTYDPAFTTFTEEPLIALVPGGAELIVAARIREDGNQRRLAVLRYSAISGALLGETRWEPTVGGVPNDPDVPRALFVDPDLGLAYVVVLSGFGDQLLHAVSFRIDDLQLQGELLLQSGTEDGNVLLGGSAVTPDLDALVVASNSDTGVLGDDPLLLACVDLPELSPRWTRRVDATGVGELRVLNSRTVAVRRGSLNIEGTLGLYDLADGRLLEGARALEGLFFSEFSPPHTRSAGRRILMFGRKFDVREEASYRVLEAASLLAGPERLVGGPLNLVLDAEESSAADAYWILGTRSGALPGLPLGSVTVPLNPDGYGVYLIRNANQGPLTDTLGTLDDRGTARAVIQYPTLSPSLFGITLHHAAIAWDPVGFDVDFVTAAVPLTIG